MSIIIFRILSIASGFKIFRGLTHVYVSFQNFYKSDIDKHDMYIRYIYKLKELHEASGNHTEAAFTLLLHAELLQFSDSIISEDKNLAEWELKEDLYKQMIDHLDQGKVGVFLDQVKSRSLSRSSKGS